MATVRASLLRKLKNALRHRFPAPATVELDDHEGIIGVVTSTDFAGMDGIDRQELIGKIIAANLTKEEQRRVQIVVGVTPDEGTGYLATVD